MESGIVALMNKLEARYADKHVVCNIFNEFHLMAFDILGELAYGKSFNMIDRESHPFPTWIKVEFLLNIIAFSSIVDTKTLPR